MGGVHLAGCVLILMCSVLPVGSIIPVFTPRLRSTTLSVQSSDPIPKHTDSSLKVIAFAGPGAAWISSAAQTASTLSIAGSIWYTGSNFVNKFEPIGRDIVDNFESIGHAMQGIAVCMAVLVSPIVGNALTRVFVFLRSIFRKEPSSEVCEVDVLSFAFVAQH